jgi:hypothetical protein
MVWRYLDRIWRSRNPESRDSGVRGTGWLQMFGRLDIESADGQR